MKKSLILAATAINALNPLSGNPLQPGATTPEELSVTLDTGETHDLARTFNEGWTLIFFYPKAFTPGCTRQACSLRDDFEWMKEGNVAVFGVSQDTVEKQARFREEENLPYPLIADPDQEVHRALGVKPFQRIAFLIRDGKVLWVDKGSTTDQAEKAREAFESHAGTSG